MTYSTYAELSGGAGHEASAAFDSALNAAERKRLPADAFAGPGRTWPIYDKAHVRSALAYYNAGKGRQAVSAAEWEAIGHKIAAAATREFGSKHTCSGGKIETAGKSAGDAGGSPIGDTAQAMRCADCGAAFGDDGDDADAGSCPYCGSAAVAPISRDPGDPTNADSPALDAVTAGAAYSMRYVPVPVGAGIAGAMERMAVRDAVASAALDGETRSQDEDGRIYAEDTFQARRGEWEILAGDAGPGGLLRVRQKAMRADAVNGNGRIYPRRVVEAAIARARPLAMAGAMLSDFIHPQVVQKPGGDEAFAAEPFAKTARVDAISSVAPDGWVSIDRTILDTPSGRQVADSLKGGRPVGLSTRFRMKGHYGSVDEPGGSRRRVHVADEMEIHTWDDVPNPAFADAGRDFQLLTDSQLAGLTGIAATHRAATHRGQPLNEEIQRAANDLFGLIEERAPKGQVIAARRALSDEIKLAKRAGENIVEATRLALSADEAMRLTGYRAGEGPLAVEANQLRGTGKGFAPDSENRAEEPDEATNPMPPDGNDEDADDDVRGRASMDHGRKKAQSAQKGAGSDAGADDMAFLRRLREREARATADAERKALIDQVCEDLAVREMTATDGVGLAGLAPDAREYILGRVRAMASGQTNPTKESVAKLVADEVEAFGALMAKERLAGMGYGGYAAGATTADPANPVNRTGAVAMTHVTEPMHPAFDAAYRDVAGQTPEVFAGVNKLLLAADDHIRHSSISGLNNPSSPDRQKIRAYNLKKLFPILNDVAARYHSSKTAAEWIAKQDTLMNQGEKAFCDSILRAAGDATTTTQLWNQPTVMIALLIQSFWDMKMFQFVEGIGPGLAPADQPGAGWFKQAGANGAMGNFLRLPVEFVNYGGMSGYAAKPLPNYDPGLLVPENTGIDELSIETTWLTYQSAWRRIAAQPTRDAIRAMGQGPLNYPVVARELFHMGFAHSRTVDIALNNEMFQIADEYSPTVVTTGSPETPNLTNNSVYNSGGSVVVNLNPTKTAGAAVSATDPSVAYGANVVGAIRLQTSGNGSSSPYFGVAPAAGTTQGTVPIVRPRATNTLSAAGQITANTTSNAITLASYGSTAPVQGAFDVNGNIVSYAGSSGANFAVDYNNGVLCITSALVGSGLGWTAGSGILAAVGPTTIAYSYATNFDRFTVNNPVIPQGLMLEDYLVSLLGQLDASAAKLASYPNYMPPDLLLCSELASTWFTRAKVFWNWASPKETVLYPTPDFFASRNGISMARSNVPGWAGDSRALLTQMGSTKLGVNTPFEIRGPQFPYDSSGKPIAREVYYGESEQTIATPQVQDQSGNVLNHVARTILLQ